MVLIALISYLAGTVGVTVVGNVPLNEALETISIRELSVEQMKTTRATYEVKWNMYHKIRTLCAVVSFSAVLLSQVNHQ